MSDLRNKIIKLAHDKPDLREDLLPLLKSAGRGAKDLSSTIDSLSHLQKNFQGVGKNISQKIEGLKKEKDRFSFLRGKISMLLSRAEFIRNAYTYVKENPGDVSSKESFPRDANDFLRRSRNVLGALHEVESETASEDLWGKSLYYFRATIKETNLVVADMLEDIESELE